MRSRVIAISPFFAQGGADSSLPAPPYLIAFDNSVLRLIIGLDYQQGLGPSAASQNFQILGDGLTPAAGNITVTPSSNIEVFDGTIWRSTSFSIVYTGGSLTTGLIYAVRLKAGLPRGDYFSETLTLSGGVASPFVIQVFGEVDFGLYIVATGGTRTQDGDYTVHEYNDSDDFEVIYPGIAPYNEVEYLVQAGGGGGGPGWLSVAGGGGGGGGSLPGTLVVTAQTYPVMVGAGGSGGIGAAEGSLGAAPASNGGDSFFGAIVAKGGGAGGAPFSQSNTNANGSDGGSGGGGGSISGGLPAIAGNGVAGQGNKGGDGTDNGTWHAGGGGGSDTPGSSGFSNSNGGDGISSGITGTIRNYGGGGGGAVRIGTPGSGGLGGGGDGSNVLFSGNDGLPNTGGGGGGCGGDGGVGVKGGDGGSGKNVIRYFNPS